MRPVNLIPVEERRGASRAPAGSTGNGVYFVLGGLALAVVAVLVVVTTSNKIKSQESALASLKAEKEEVTQKAADDGVAPDAAFELAAQARFDAVKQKANDRFDFERRLRQLTRVLPPNVKIKTLTGTLSGNADVGAAASAAGGAVDPSFKIEMCILGYHSIWTQVADLITRMRNLDGVDKVTADKASKPTPDSSTGAAAPAAPPADPSSPTTGTATAAAGPCSRPDASGVTLKVSFQPPGASAAAATTAAAPRTATQQAQGAASTASTTSTAAGADGSAPKP